MSDILTCEILDGDGTLWVDNPNPMPGEDFTIYAQPDNHCQLVDLYMVESHGWSVAITVTEVQTMPYNSDWGDCTIYAEFTSWTWPFYLLFKKKKHRQRIMGLF